MSEEVQRLARVHYRRRRALAKATAARARGLWLELDRADLTGSWQAIAPRLFAVVATAQLAAAGQSDGYVTAALAAQNATGDAAGELVPSRLAGIASDGRPLESLLYEPVIGVKERIGRGAETSPAMRSGLAHLVMIAATQVQDAGRVGDSVSTMARRRAKGYVRMLTPPSCSRCAILAGAFYKAQTAFNRHPHCDCQHIPAAENAPELRTDPRRYFDSLSRADQDRIFTGAGAQSIRDGADLGQVVNARRAAAGLAPAGARLTTAEARALRGGRDRGHLEARRVFGQDVYTTTEGTTRHGQAGRRLGGQTPRLMPESIYAIARDRDEALRLLRRFGYIA